MRKKVFVVFLASVFSFFLSVFSISKVSAAYLSEYNVSREEDVLENDGPYIAPAEMTNALDLICEYLERKMGR